MQVLKPLLNGHFKVRIVTNVTLIKLFVSKYISLSHENTNTYM